MLRIFSAQPPKKFGRSLRQLLREVGAHISFNDTGFQNSGQDRHDGMKGRCFQFDEIRDKFAPRNLGMICRSFMKTFSFLPYFLGIDPVASLPNEMLFDEPVPCADERFGTPMISADIALTG